MKNARKLWIFNIYFMISLIFIASSHAGDVSAPHTLEAGEVISAEVLNELFEHYQSLHSEINSIDIVGNWTCTSTWKYSSSATSNPGYTIGPDNLYMSWDYTALFADDGDGTYSWSSSPGNLFWYNWNADADSRHHSGSYAIVGNAFYFNDGIFSDPSMFTHIRKISDTTIRLDYNDSGDIRTTKCNKVGAPPLAPTNLAAAASDVSATLSWSDNSSDETGFKIMRKNSLAGNYSEITTTSAGTSSYVDSDLAAGIYWYRIKATNASGDSLGSNVARGVISE